MIFVTISWAQNGPREKYSEVVMILTKNLTKEYDGFCAVDGLNLHIEKGEIYGFLGPNGAGKTTTMLMLLGILKPTAGEIYLMGERLESNPLALKQRIGVVSEKQYFYKEMIATEYLNFFAELYGVQGKAERIDKLLGAVDLVGAKNKKLGAYSRGMQQKLGFARALLHDPDLLLLDEPVSGLDPTGIKQVRDLIEDENRKGRTIFISSHLLSEVERLCTRVGIINKGRLLAEDDMDSLRRRLSSHVQLEIELSKMEAKIQGALEKLEFVRGVQVKDNTLVVEVNADKDYRATVSGIAAKEGGVVLGIRKLEMSLEEAFLTLTQKNISLLADRQETTE
jgi:ABC-2 type transport system ATP-binding protein